MTLVNQNKIGGKNLQKTIRSGSLKGFYIIDCNWSKKELEDFLKQIKSTQEKIGHFHK